MMENKTTIYKQIIALAIFVALPISIYLTADFPRRSSLKEAISLITILAFFIMLLQFYLSRGNKTILRNQKMGKVIKWHKALGYGFVSILIFHPFLIVVPRYFEAGISPQDAFIELLSNFSHKGLLLGLIAWLLMIIIGLTSFFRAKLPFTYKTWRVIHGILSMTFIIIASYHIIDMGRHINQTMAWVITLLSTLGVAFLLRIYLFKSISSKNNDHA